MAGGSRAHGLRRGAVVDRTPRNATLHQHDLLSWRPLDVERYGDGACVHRMVDEREALAGHPFADAPGHERAALSHRLPAQTGERHDPKDFGDGQLLEDRLVVARRELDPIAIQRALLAGARPDRLPANAVDAHADV